MIANGFIVLALLGAAAPAAGQAAETSATSQTTPGKETQEATPKTTPDQRIKCKRISVTGSLVRRQKLCKTMAEWREFYREGARSARELVDSASNGTTNGQ